MSDLKKSLVSGALWSVGGQVFSLLIVLITNIWLARLLSPREFGQVGIIMFFITIANVLSEGGMVGALVRKVDVSKADYATVFIFNLSVSFILYITLLAISPFIAAFYNDYELNKLLAISGFILIINALQITQFAKILSEHKFKRNAIYRFSSVLIASIIGVFYAYRGGGVMALVAIQLLTSLIMTIQLWLFEGVFFSIRFSKKSFIGLYKFGVNTTIASILTTAFENIYQLILGKYFSIRQVGLYYQAKKLQDIPGGLINMVAQNVVYSIISKLQNDKSKFTNVFDKIFVFFAALQYLCCGLIYLYAKPIMHLLFGNKWIDSVVYLQLLSLATVFTQIELINRLIFKVFNKTEKVLQLEVIKKTIQMLTIIIGVFILNIKILLIGFIISNVISYFLNHIYSRKIIEQSYQKGLKDLFMIILWTIVMIIVFQFLLNKLSVNSNIALMTIPVFCLIYILGLYGLKIINVISFFKTMIYVK